VTKESHRVKKESHRVKKEARKVRSAQGFKEAIQGDIDFAVILNEAKNLRRNSILSMLFLALLITDILKKTSGHKKDGVNSLVGVVELSV